MRYFLFEILGLAAAVQNRDDNTCEDHRSCWSATAVKYDDDQWKTCRTDNDCADGNYCLSHMWAYNDQKETGKGCWPMAVCSGTGAFVMFEERNI